MPCAGRLIPNRISENGGAFTVPESIPTNELIYSKLTPVLIVHVHVHVQPEFIEAFRTASTENARLSIQEPGIARFDIVQQADDPARFIILEVYRQADAPARHKESAHYQQWRDSVAGMMAGPRTSVKFSNVFPSDAGW